MQIVIDTHKFVKFLSEEKHFTQKQAEVLIEAATEYHNAYTKELATKQDMRGVKKDLETKIDSLKKDMQSNFYKTVIALGSINVAVITIALAIFSIVK